MIVKICGITRAEDASAGGGARRDRARLHLLARQPAARRAGGRGSDRSALPPFVWKVGVFVDAPADDIDVRSREARP